jgi:2'-5' RNA ligase superfamily
MSPFPARQPSLPEDPAATRDNDWRTFQALPGMEDHWPRPGWTPGRRSWHWMLAVDDDPVRQLARHCQDVLGTSPIGERLDPVPLDALHVTLGRIGFTDEIDQATALAAATEAASACADLSAFPVEVGPLAGSRGALRFSLAPWTPLLTVHERLTRATGRVLGDRCVMDTDAFRPHLSIAYAHDTIPMQELLG